MIFKKIEETLALGGTGVLMQGGHHPDLGIEYYEDLFRSIKERYKVHLHALSPPEVQHISRRSKLDIAQTLTRLRDAGLDSLPGGGGEVLVDRVREIIAPKKTKTAEWLGVMRHAHRLGISTTATMMYGHVETLEERVEHMQRIRELQDETHGFRAFISWTFQDDGNRLGALVPPETRPTSFDYLLTQAVSRHLPRQRPPHPELVGHPGHEAWPDRPRVRCRRYRLDHDRGERRLRRRDDLPGVHRGFRSDDQVARKVPVQRDTLYREVRVLLELTGDRELAVRRSTGGRPGPSGGSQAPAKPLAVRLRRPD